ncbi:MAG TPA: CotH kinase family protein [Kofleriaceae bacterium]|nr:CotH kinase family protein [Kofleriaceae bacterium]
MNAVIGVTLALALGTGCGSEGNAEPDAGALDAGVDAGPGYEAADWLFETDRLLAIDIELSAGDWDAIRFQSRDILGIFGETCGLQPAGSPFTYVSGTVTIEGQTITQVGIRKKGFLGSLDDDKPSLKLDFAEYVPGQRFSGLTKMTLNNDKQDPSHMDQCLGYELFRAAGVPAPRCNYARVTVNGVPLGIYTHVESMGKPMLSRHFADTGGNLYEGTLSDFRDGWMGTFERKTNKADLDRSDLQAIYDALALTDDAAMLAAVEAVIDLDAFFSFWAIETMTSHWDGYAGNNNNFFLYGDPSTGRMTFLPWGTDQLFGPGASLDPGLTRSALTERLFLHGPARARYLTRYGAILDEVWDDDALLLEIDRVETLLADAILADETQAWQDAMAELRATLTGREQLLRTALSTTGPGDVDPVSDPLCFDDIGTLDATFTVAYENGSTTVTLAIDAFGSPVPLANLAVYAAPSNDVPDQSVLYVTADTDNSRTIVLFIAMPDHRVMPGTITLGATGIEAALVVFPPGGGDPETIYFLGGNMTLSSGTATPGSTWQGSVTATLWDPPFF